ncbi:hypothetical protein EU528_10915 [Candidatus Thorarchaeota archaeon]|nr:MAG: hypothetical protein EU528_10915 [Candidatus Thorarchaeota archaeon]
MLEYPIKSVHGHTLSELEDILEDSCDSFDDIVVLESTSQGGWSNINIRGSASGLDFILKLPWSTEKYLSNPYERLYKLGLQFARLNIASHPIEVGRLDDSCGTPFFLIEYVDGTTRSTLTDANEDEIHSLKESLRILKEQKPSGIPKYESPSDYLLANHEQVDNHPWLRRASDEAILLLDKYNSLFPKVESAMDIIGYWSGDVMHGDLWIPNIVFRKSSEVLLLDFDACAYGDSRYDLTRLIEGDELDDVPMLIPDEDLNFVNSLRPLVLSYVIDWSINRLLSMESGIVESNLNTIELRQAIIGHTKEKIARLTTLLH